MIVAELYDDFQTETEIKKMLYTFEKSTGTLIVCEFIIAIIRIIRILISCLPTCIWLFKAFVYVGIIVRNSGCA